MEKEEQAVNSMLYSTLHQVHNVPPEYTPIDLRRQLVKEMVNNKDTIYPLVKEDLRKLDISYYELIRDVADNKFIPLKPCLKLLRIFLVEPIRVVVPKVSRTEKGGRGGTKKVVWIGQELFAFTSDSNLPSKSFRITLVYNGIRYVAPCLPRAIVNIETRLEYLTENVEGAIEDCTKALDMVPSSEAQVALSQMQVYLKASDTILRGLNMHLGTSSAEAEDSPLVPVPSTGVAPSRKRRRLSEEDGDGASGAQKQKLTEGLTASDNCQMEPFRCACGMMFDSKDELDGHLNTMHQQYYKCSQEGCEKIYTTRDSAWRHFRQNHLNRYHYKCPDCGKKEDDPNAMKKHMSDKHGSAKSQLYCKKCNKTFPQKNKFLLHQKLCGNKVKPFVCNEDGCYKAFRSKYWLQLHKKSVHSQAGEPTVCYPCPYVDCKREYRSKQALVHHQKEAKHTKEDIERERLERQQEQEENR